MSKTYKHQTKFNSRRYWRNYSWSERLTKRKDTWEPPDWWSWQTIEDRSRDYYRKMFWRKLRHQWKKYLKDGGKEPHNKPENFDWILW